MLRILEIQGNSRGFILFQWFQRDSAPNADSNLMHCFHVKIIMTWFTYTRTHTKTTGNPCVTNWAKIVPKREEGIYHWYYLKEGHKKVLGLNFSSNGNAGVKKALTSCDFSPYCVVHSSEQAVKTQTGILLFGRKSVPWQ